MTKGDLITVIADKLKFPWARAELLVDVVFDCLEQSMSRGEKIEIRGFGTFQVRSYGGYKGRNPRTGLVVAVRPKRLPHFKVGRELARRISQRGGEDQNATATGEQRSCDELATTGGSPRTCAPTVVLAPRGGGGMSAITENL